VVLQGWAGYLAAATIGCVIGWIELGQRYSDRPVGVLAWPAAWLYLATNVAATQLALAVTRTFGWSFGQSGDAREVVQVLGSGLGAMLLFRTRLFTAAQADEAFVWSPATLLEGTLKIADRQARREQARDRIQATQEMAKLTWKQAEELAPVVLAVMDMGGDEQKEFAKDFKALVKNPEGYPDTLRVQLLGVAILKFAGPKVLLEAIRQITKQPTD
jgi:hypothetical protein